MPIITAALLKALCKEHKMYQSPRLNDKLYLHFKGFKRIENLEEYTELSALWLEGNAISKIENMNHLSQMKCL